MAFNKYASESIPNRDVSRLEAKFDARVEDSKEYRQYARQVPYFQWDGSAPINTTMQIIPMKAIHLTSDNLEKMLAEQDYFYRMEEDYNYSKKIVNMLRADERVRDDNPAVAKAYRNYLTLLELARK